MAKYTGAPEKCREFEDSCLKYLQRRMNQKDNPSSEQAMVYIWTQMDSQFLESIFENSDKLKAIFNDFRELRMCTYKKLQDAESNPIYDFLDFMRDAKSHTFRGQHGHELLATMKSLNEPLNKYLTPTAVNYLNLMREFERRIRDFDEVAASDDRAPFELGYLGIDNRNPCPVCGTADPFKHKLVAVYSVTGTEVQSGSSPSDPTHAIIHNACPFQPNVALGANTKPVEVKLKLRNAITSTHKVLLFLQQVQINRQVLKELFRDQETNVYSFDSMRKALDRYDINQNVISHIVTNTSNAKGALSLNLVRDEENHQDSENEKEEPIMHVNSVGNKSLADDDDCSSDDDLATNEADEVAYIRSKGQKGRFQGKGKKRGTNWRGFQVPRRRARQGTLYSRNPRKNKRIQSRMVYQARSLVGVKKCYACGSTEHLIAQCPRKDTFKKLPNRMQAQQIHAVYCMHVEEMVQEANDETKDIFALLEQEEDEEDSLGDPIQPSGPGMAVQTVRLGGVTSTQKPPTPTSKITPSSSSQDIPPPCLDFLNTAKNKLEEYQFNAGDVLDFEDEDEEEVRSLIQDLFICTVCPDGQEDVSQIDCIHPCNCRKCVQNYYDKIETRQKYSEHIDSKIALRRLLEYERGVAIRKSEAEQEIIDPLGTKGLRYNTKLLMGSNVRSVFQKLNQYDLELAIINHQLNSIMEFSPIPIPVSKVNDQEICSPGEIVLDTGAGITVGSTEAIQKFVEESRRLGCGAPVKLPSRRMFKYADSSVGASLGRWLVPYQTGQIRGVIAIEEITGSGPILMGLPQMRELRPLYDVEGAKLTLRHGKDKIKIKLGTPNNKAHTINLLTSVTPEQLEKLPNYNLGTHEVEMKDGRIVTASAIYGLEDLRESWRASHNIRDDQIPTFCKRAHQLLGHDRHKVVQVLRDTGLGERIISAYQDYCDLCPHCKQYQAKPRVPKVSVANLAWKKNEKVSIDLFELFMEGKQGEAEPGGTGLSIPLGKKAYFFHLVDHYSKYSFIRYLEKKDAKSVKQAIEQWRELSGGYPSEVFHDPGPEFENLLVHETLGDFGCTLHRGPVDTAWKQSLVERQNAIAKRMLKIVISSIGKVTTEDLHHAALSVSSSKNQLPRGDGLVPFSLIHGNECAKFRFPQELILDGTAASVHGGSCRDSYARECEIHLKAKQAAHKLQASTIIDRLLQSQAVAFRGPYAAGDVLDLYEEKGPKIDHGWKRSGTVIRMEGDSIVVVWTSGGREERFATINTRLQSSLEPLTFADRGGRRVIVRPGADFSSEQLQQALENYKNFQRSVGNEQWADLTLESVAKSSAGIRGWLDYRVSPKQLPQGSPDSFSEPTQTIAFSKQELLNLDKLDWHFWRDEWMNPEPGLWIKIHSLGSKGNKRTRKKWYVPSSGGKTGPDVKTLFNGRLTFVRENEKDEFVVYPHYNLDWEAESKKKEGLPFNWYGASVFVEKTSSRLQDKQIPTRPEKRAAPSTPTTINLDEAIPNPKRVTTERVQQGGSTSSGTLPQVSEQVHDLGQGWQRTASTEVLFGLLGRHVKENRRMIPGETVKFGYQYNPRQKTWVLRKEPTRGLLSSLNQFYQRIRPGKFINSANLCQKGNSPNFQIPDLGNEQIVILFKEGGLVQIKIHDGTNESYHAVLGCLQETDYSFTVTVGYVPGADPSQTHQEDHQLQCSNPVCLKWRNVTGKLKNFFESKPNFSCKDLHGCSCNTRADTDTSGVWRSVAAHLGGQVYGEKVSQPNSNNAADMEKQTLKRKRSKSPVDWDDSPKRHKEEENESDPFLGEDSDLNTPMDDSSWNDSFPSSDEMVLHLEFLGGQTGLTEKEMRDYEIYRLFDPFIDEDKAIRERAEWTAFCDKIDLIRGNNKYQHGVIHDLPNGELQMSLNESIPTSGTVSANHLNLVSINSVTGTDAQGNNLTPETLLEQEEDYAFHSKPGYGAGFVPVNLVQKELTQQQVDSCPIDPQFRKAKEKELQSFVDNNSFEVVPRPAGKVNMIPYRWVCTYKHEDAKQPHKVTRTKARLVYKGFKDQRLLTGLSTDAPTVNFGLLRMAISLGLSRGWLPKSFDISTAFLRGKNITGNAYSEVPPGLERLMNIPPGSVLKMKSCVYGLGDAPREWYLTLRDYLTKTAGFQVSRVDPSVFLYYEDVKSGLSSSESLLTRDRENQQRQERFEMIKKNLLDSAEGRLPHDLVDFIDHTAYEGKVLSGIICIHVDDGLVMGSEDFLAGPMRKVMEHYQMEKLEEGSFKYLGGVMTAQWDERKRPEVVIDYTHIAEKIPMIPLPSGMREDTPLDKELHQAYRSTLGAALYLSLHGHPLSACDVNMASSYAADPTAGNAAMLNTIVKRIKNNPLRIKLMQLRSPELGVFADASFANGRGGKSQSGRVIIMIDRNPVDESSGGNASCASPGADSNLLLWKSQTLKRVVHSTRAAETLSCLEGVDNLRLLQFLFFEIQLKFSQAMLYTDCGSLVANLKKIVAPKEKNLLLSIQQLKEWLSRGHKAYHVSTQANLADCLTKHMTYSDVNLLRIISEQNKLYGITGALANTKRKLIRKDFWRTKVQNKMISHEVTDQDLPGITDEIRRTLPPISH